MARFHLNPARGPLPCTAVEGQCPYGEDALHFTSRAEAKIAYERDLEASTSPLHGIRRPLKKSSAVLKSLGEKLDVADYETIFSVANLNPESHRLVGELIDERAASSPARFEAINALDRNNPNAIAPISSKNFRLMMQEWKEYRDQTAVFIEAFHASEFYKASTVPYGDGPVGAALPHSVYAHDDPNWYLSRFNTIGGSDVGALALQDFVAWEDIASLDRLYIRKIQESKMKPPTVEEAYGSMALSNRRRGPLYRGTVWEDHIRDSFAKDHPEFVVYHTAGQYIKAGSPWYKVNFDGVIGDKSDGKARGILEIKTGGDPTKWANGLPLTYRAQTLYYLNATGLDFAIVRGVINDGEIRDFKLYRSDEVFPGSGVTMDKYIDTKVLPWFEQLKAQRESA